MTHLARIAVVEDDPVLLDIITRTLKERGYDVGAFADGRSFLGALEAGDTPEAAFLDLKLPDADGIVLLRRLRSDIPACRVVMMTAYASFESVLDSLREGAVEYLVKPVTAREIVAALERSLRRRRPSDRISEPAQTFLTADETPVDDLGEIMGSSALVAEIGAFVRKAAAVEVPILLTGETGTGKEVVARAIHASSVRSGREMVSVNCGAIPEPLFESELFGHVRGAFTGAERDRTGLIEAADGSTLFLDEVAEIPLSSQVKLLRTLQEGALRPVGASIDRQVDIRIIAATNTVLEDAVRRGAFRQDLFYRLSVLRYRLPPLRERSEDIPHLIDRFLSLYARSGQSGSPRFSRRALKAMCRYPWPGNVRELENEVARVTTLAEEERIELNDLSDEIRAAQQVRGAGSLRAALDFKERQMIISCLEQTGWNKTETARLLGMSRQNLYGRLEYHGIPLTPADGGPEGVKMP